MSEFARFSSGSNRAHEVDWRPWSPAAFGEAAQTDRPIFLNISTVWCQWCDRMDELVFSDESIIRQLNQHFIPIRVDGDHYPHVQDRYIAGGWPTNAFLTPTGEVLWAATYTEAEQLKSAAQGVLGAWSERREEFQHEIERRRRALESSRKRHTALGLVRREAADDVLAATRDAFDHRYGGFGTAPKFPSPRAIELLYLQARSGDPGWADMADRTLDGMLSGELFDRADGGFFRYATAEDWTSPRREKLLDVNAALLRAYALGAHLRGHRDWHAAVEQTVEWIDRVLLQPRGLWGGSQYPEASERGAIEHRKHTPPGADPTVYTGWNAQWIAALADAGARFDRADWVERSATALETLLEIMAAPGDLLHHFLLPDGQPELPVLLADSLHAGIASMAVAQATGSPQWLAEARRIANGIEKAFWAEDGGFWDRVRSSHDLGVLRYRDRPFELNAEAARFLLDLSGATGERKFSALAERILALLSPQAGRYGVDGATFALAVEEFFEAPTRFVIAGEQEAGHHLRRAALLLGIPGRRVFAVRNGDRIGPLHFATDQPAAAFACGPRGCSPPVTDPDRLAAAANAVA